MGGFAIFTALGRHIADHSIGVKCCCCSALLRNLLVHFNDIQRRSWKSTILKPRPLRLTKIMISLGYEKAIFLRLSKLLAYRKILLWIVFSGVAWNPMAFEASYLHISQHEYKLQRADLAGHTQRHNHHGSHQVSGLRTPYEDEPQHRHQVHVVETGSARIG